MAAKQPGYYEKKYFDAQFGFVVEKIESVESEMKRINGSLNKTVQVQTVMIKKYLPQHKKMVKKVNGIEKKYIFISGVATTAGTVIGYLASTLIK